MVTYRQTKPCRAPAVVSASLVDGQRNTKTQQTCTRKLEMHSGFRSRVCPSPAPLNVRCYDVQNIDPRLCGNIDKEAGLAFEKAASIQTQNLNEPDDAANSLQEAFKVYRKSDPEDAARVLSSAIQHYVLKGNFRRAATQQQYLAEVYEVELGDQKKALEAYEKAAEWFDSDNAEAYVVNPPFFHNAIY